MKPPERKLAIVTGGTSGIGAAIARQLAPEYQLALVFREDESRARELVERLRADGSLAKAYRKHLRSPDDAEDLLEQIRQDFPEPVSILVNAHGRAQNSLFLQSNTQVNNDIVSEMLLVPMALCRLVIPAMAREKFGRVLNISSIAAGHHRPGRIAYATAKAGLEAFTRGVALEVSRYGVTVNAIAPGAVDTPLLRRASAPEIEAVVEKIPARRLGLAEEVAELAAFLCSERASYITGAVLPVDGGLSAL